MPPLTLKGARRQNTIKVSEYRARKKAGTVRPRGQQQPPQRQQQQQLPLQQNAATPAAEPTQRHQQSQTARPPQSESSQQQQKKKEVKRNEIKKVELSSTKQQSQSQKQQKPKEQNVETIAEAAEPPADLPQPVMAESPVAPAQEEDKDLCFDSTPPIDHDFDYGDMHEQDASANDMVSAVLLAVAETHNGEAAVNNNHFDLLETSASNPNIAKFIGIRVLNTPPSSRSTSPVQGVLNLEASAQLHDADMDEDEQYRKLFGDGLSLQFTEDDLQSFYSQSGTITAVMKDPTTRRSRGFGFVTSTSTNEVDEAMNSRSHIIQEIEPKSALLREASQKNEYIVYVSGVRDEHGEKTFEDYFSKYGSVEKVEITKDKATGEYCGYAFIYFNNSDALEKCCLERQHMILNHRCDVTKALTENEIAKAQQIHSFLCKMKDTALQNNISAVIPENLRENLLNYISDVGLMCRRIDFDKMIQRGAIKQGEEPSSPKMPNEKREIGMYAETIYSYLLFFSRSTDLEVSRKAILSLGHLCSEYPDFFERVELRNMYHMLLVSADEEHLPLKIEVLKNLTLFLIVEDEKMMKARKEYHRLQNTGVIEDDLTNSDTRGSINSAVIQVFWKHALSSYIHHDSEVRIAVSQVVYQAMMQGLVTPDGLLPIMIAMTTDSIPSIRNMTEPLIKIFDAKYSGKLVTKAVLGIRWTFETHKRLNTNNIHVTRGFRASEHCTDNALDKNGLPKTSSEAVAVLNALYSCLRTNRNQRRSFLKNVIALLSDDSQKKPTLEEKLFIADNLATFPYQVADEPLFIIHTVDQIISLTGHPFLTSIEEFLFYEIEDELTPENIYKRLPDDNTAITQLIKRNLVCYLLLYIKTYLIKAYKLTEAKLKEYDPLQLLFIAEEQISIQQIPVFRPDTILQELRPEFVQHIVDFRNMLYSRDIHELEEDDKQESSDETTTNEPSTKRRRVISL